MYEIVRKRVENAVNALQQGHCVVLLDSATRENEGDLIFPAQQADAEKIALMLQYTSGIICLAMGPNHGAKLQLPPMVRSDDNNSRFHTPFTVSIEAKTGVTTGVSAADRAHTIQVASRPDSQADELVKPGHVFPLIAQQYGVLQRPGHTEGSVDLVKLAGFHETAVLCELMNPDGTMMNKHQLEAFADSYDFPLLSIEDIRLYRLANEQYLRHEATTLVPFKQYGELQCSAFMDPITNKEVVALHHSLDKQDRPVVRIHSSCITGDLFGSLKCDCQSQLHHALDYISQHGGLLVYLEQEGRDIGLANKLKAYELQRTQQLDTVEANIALGLPVDARQYDAAIQVLRYYGIHQCQLFSNNPSKLQALAKANIQVTRLASLSEIQPLNERYLKTKTEKLKHMIQGVQTDVSD